MSLACGIESIPDFLDVLRAVLRAMLKGDLTHENTNAVPHDSSYAIYSLY